MSNTRISSEVISEIRTNQEASRRKANTLNALRSMAKVAAASNRDVAHRSDVDEAPTMTIRTTAIPSPSLMPRRLGESLHKVPVRTTEEQAELDRLVAQQAAEQEVERIAAEQEAERERLEHPDEYPNPKEEYLEGLVEDSSYNLHREEVKLHFADKRRGVSNVDADYNGAPDPNDDPIDPGFVGQGMHIEVPYVPVAVRKHHTTNNRK